jgi:hypothetical protein
LARFPFFYAGFFVIVERRAGPALAFMVFTCA